MYLSVYLTVLYIMTNMQRSDTVYICLGRGRGHFVTSHHCQIYFRHLKRVRKSYTKPLIVSETDSWDGSQNVEE